MTSTPRISLVAACDRALGIGRDNRLPWHLPADLAHFKAVTLGHTVIMGSRTFASIGRALPGRQNLVLSRDPSKSFPGATRVASVEAALSTTQGERLMVIGGAQVYRAFLPLAHEILLTRVNTDAQADTFFPALPAGDWTLVEETARAADAANAHAMCFQQWRRSAPP